MSTYVIDDHTKITEQKHRESNVRRPQYLKIRLIF